MAVDRNRVERTLPQPANSLAKDFRVVESGKFPTNTVRSSSSSSGAVASPSSSSSSSTLFDEDQYIPTLFPLLPLDYIGFTCMIIGLILAAGGGIGGGGILVPIYILIFDFPIKHSISLASVTVLGGSIAK